MDTEGGTVEWLTLREAAQRVDTSTKTLRRKAIAGELVAQRAGEADTSPWLISSVSLAEMYGEIAEAATQAIAPEGTTAVLSEQLTTALQMMNDANTQAIEATERAAIAETVAGHLREVNSDQRGTIADLQNQLETSRADPKKRRGWWRR